MTWENAHDVLRELSEMKTVHWAIIFVTKSCLHKHNNLSAERAGFEFCLMEEAVVVLTEELLAGGLR
jgi:hypothetical protein